jgi:hypothetical protein
VGPKAGDANDYIVYDKGTGVVSYDADGNGRGAAVAFAKVKPGTALPHPGRLRRHLIKDTSNQESGEPDGSPFASALKASKSLSAVPR